MPTSFVALPDDPETRRVFLLGMDSAHRGLDDADVALARPALEPWRGEFDRGRRVGLDMVPKNAKRKRALQQGIVGRVWRIFAGKAAAKARKDAIPELP